MIHYDRIEIMLIAFPLGIIIEIATMIVGIVICKRDNKENDSHKSD